MLNFAALKTGDKLAYYGEQKVLEVEMVDSDGDWWMVTFKNDGRNIKSGDPSYILNDFDLLCAKCGNEPVAESGDYCLNCKNSTTGDYSLKLELVMDGRNLSQFIPLLERIFTENGLGDAIGIIQTIPVNDAQMNAKEWYYRSDVHHFNPMV